MIPLVLRNDEKIENDVDVNDYVCNDDDDGEIYHAQEILIYSSLQFFKIFIKFLSFQIIIIYYQYQIISS